MLVRLTERQAHWVRRAFDGHPAEDLVERFFAQAPSLGHSVDVTMPPDAWAWAARWLFSNVYSVSGGRRQNAGTAAQRAHRRVISAMNDRRRHPAFRKAGMLGVQGEWMTGWRTYRLAPFFEDVGHPTAQFVLLVPSPTRWGKETVTVWEPFLPSEISCTEELADESLHIPFAHQSA